MKTGGVACNDDDGDDLSALAEVATSEPVDTMNLGDIPPVIEQRTAAGAAAGATDDGDGRDAGETRLILFPSQIHKIAAAVTLLAAYRDRLDRLQQLHLAGGAKGSLADSFDWRAQLRYKFDAEKQALEIKVSRGGPAMCCLAVTYHRNINGLDMCTLACT